MKSNAENYFETALEHLGRAEKFFHSNEADRNYLTHYFAGLAVECILRAYLRRATDQFESNHSLEYLAGASGFYDLLPDDKRVEYVALFNDLTLRWNANHRYFSEKAVRDHLHQIKADVRLKGEQFRNNARTALEYARRIIAVGESRW